MSMAFWKIWWWLQSKAISPYTAFQSGDSAGPGVRLWAVGGSVGRAAGTRQPVCSGPVGVLPGRQAKHALVAHTGSRARRAPSSGTCGMGGRSSSGKSREPQKSHTKPPCSTTGKAGTMERLGHSPRLSAACSAQVQGRAARAQAAEVRGACNLVPGAGRPRAAPHRHVQQLASAVKRPAVVGAGHARVPLHLADPAAAQGRTPAAREGRQVAVA